MKSRQKNKQKILDPKNSGASYTQVRLIHRDLRYFKQLVFIHFRFCGMIQFVGEPRKKSLIQLMVFLCHKYPKVITSSKFLLPHKAIYIPIKHYASGTSAFSLQHKRLFPKPWLCTNVSNYSRVTYLKTPKVYIFDKLLYIIRDLGKTTFSHSKSYWQWNVSPTLCGLAVLPEVLVTKTSR